MTWAARPRPREAGVGSLVGRALTWEGGTRSKFFPSIRRMCFRAWEVIWCLSRKENWQPSRMQWKWLFTWLYLQPVDTARSAVSPRGPGLRTPAARQAPLRERGSGAPQRTALGKGLLLGGGISTRGARTPASGPSRGAPDNGRLAPIPYPKHRGDHGIHSTGP